MTKPIRTAWKKFPVFKHLEPGKTRRDPEYVRAKQGSDISALILVDRLLNREVLDTAFEQFMDIKPKILPVLHPGDGTDRIPLSMACILADRFGWDVHFDVVATASNTGASPATRIAAAPSFEGEVDPGPYLLVDDSITFGATLANLRGYVEANGGTAVGAMVLTAGDDPVKPRPATLKLLRDKFGPQLNDFLQEFLGYGIARLTESEATYLGFAGDLRLLRQTLTKARAKTERIRAKQEEYDKEVLRASDAKKEASKG